MTTELTEDEWREATTYDLLDWHQEFATEEERDAAWDRFLGRVRRDALTALADHWDETVSEHNGRPLFSASGTHVRRYRDTHYPEETP